MKKFTNEMKVGLFIILAICVALIFWMKTQKRTAGGTYNLKTYFNFAGGLKENSIVTLSGIEVGRISAISFKYEPETKVEVVLSIDKKAKVHKDTIAYITSSGIIGDSYIGLTPGSGSQPFVKDGEAIASEDPIEARELMKRADAISVKLDQALVDVKKLAANLSATMEANKGSVDNIVKNLEQTSANFNDFSADIKAHPWKLLMKGKEK
jgi:phospholipid/cholesterol/gamma-HCH transport system substrate-binding protein